MGEVKMKASGKVIDLRDVVQRAREDSDKMFLQFHITIHRNGKEPLEFADQVKMPFKDIDTGLEDHLKVWVSENMVKFIEYYNENGLKTLFVGERNER